MHPDAAARWVGLENIQFDLSDEEVLALADFYWLTGAWYEVEACGDLHAKELLAVLRDVKTQGVTAPGGHRPSSSQPSGGVRRLVCFFCLAHPDTTGSQAPAAGARATVGAQCIHRHRSLMMMILTPGIVHLSATCRALIQSVLTLSFV